jgi:hypothetical protein
LTEPTCPQERENPASELIIAEKYSA